MQILHIAFPQKFTLLNTLFWLLKITVSYIFLFLVNLKLLTTKVALFLLSQVKLSKMEALELLK